MLPFRPVGSADDVSTAKEMGYDVIVATRNRPEVLGLSIPTFLSQSVRPNRLIVVDASDDHEVVRRRVEQATRGRNDVEVIILHTVPGTTAQRNVGLEHVTSTIVMFPDDDALWYDDAVPHVLETYKRDKEQRIGGVSFCEVRTPPPGVLLGSAVRSHGSLAARLLYRLSPLRGKIENVITPNPMHVCGEEFLGRVAIPRWLPEAAATPVPYILGFRMTYRSESIRACGFDETLKRYALYEDYDVSLAVLRDQLLVMAHDARVFHHRAPGARAGGVETGAILLLNLAYITCKHAEPGSRARRAIRPYGWMRTIQYLARSGSAFGRQRLRGIRRARRHLAELMEAAPEELAERYRRALSACLGG